LGLWARRATGPLPLFTTVAFHLQRKGERRGSIPQPPLEPLSADPCFRVLPDVAESAHLKLFTCSWLPAVFACCALSGVRGGVNRCRRRKRHQAFSNVMANAVPKSIRARCKAGSPITMCRHRAAASSASGSTLLVLEGLKTVWARRKGAVY
jgi:hypothetical protein